LDKLEQRYGFTAPRNKGLNTVETCKGVIEGRVKAFFGLGGNFVRAVPETQRIEAAWSSLELTVQIATKLNRSHVVHGKTAYLLPCLGRIEVDEQLSGAQSVTTEDSTGVMHPSTGVADPASPHLLSETAIVAGIAKATLPANPALPWERWVADYSLIRDEIAAIYPDIFRDFNERRQILGGFRRPVPASVRVWKTPNGKANFIPPEELVEDPDVAAPPDPEILRLMTMRSDDQFNTTVYTLNDRFRGITGTRRVILMNPADLVQLGFADGDMVNVFTAVDDGVERVVRKMKVTAFDIPTGCLAGYYPECNPLVPLWHHAKDSFVPAAKSIPVRLVKAASN
jgi:molybdopterin-dependent oxidoreductase alpha subunit